MRRLHLLQPSAQGWNEATFTLETVCRASASSFPLVNALASELSAMGYPDWEAPFSPASSAAGVGILHLQFVCVQFENHCEQGTFTSFVQVE